MRFLFLCVAFVTATVTLCGQSIRVSDIDVTGYPTITAKVAIHDSNGNPVRTLQPSDMELLLNGVAVPVEAIQCPEPEKKQPAYIVVVSDKSLSMELPVTGTLDEERIRLVTLGVSTLINTVDFGIVGTQIALTTFDTSAYILKPFTADLVALNSAAGSIQPCSFPGTNYTAAFFHSVAGAIPLLRSAPRLVQRVLVFLTDGAPTMVFRHADAIAEATAENITVYPITLDMPMTPQLQEIADATGGLAFSNVRTREEIVAIYESIARQAQASEPCTIRWKVNPCSPEGLHRATLRYPALQLSTSFTYDVSTYRALPSVRVTRDTVLCAGDSVQLQAQGSAANGAYQWYPMEGLSNAFVANPVATPTTTTTYTVLYTDGKGCSTSADVHVGVVHPRLAVEQRAVSICEGDSVQLAVSGSGTVFSWTPAAGLSNTSVARPIATPAATTTYYVTMWDGLCTASDSVTVEVFTPSHGFSVGADTSICAGGFVVLMPSLVDGQYSWTPTEGLDDAHARTPVASPMATTQYTLTVTTASGCVVQGSVAVVVHPVPTVDAGSDVHLCTGSSALLRATGTAGSWRWSPPDGLDATDKAEVVAQPQRTTTYTVVYTDAYGCVASDSVAVTVGKSAFVDAGADASICAGGEVQLQASGTEGSYEWSPATGLDNPQSRTPRATPQHTTTYVLTVVTPDGCEGSDEVTVVVHPVPTVDAGNDVELCAGDSTMLVATGGEGVYQWYPTRGLSDATSRTPMAFPSVQTVYTVAVTDAHGCQATDSVVVGMRTPSAVRFSLRDVPQQSVPAGRPTSFALAVDNLDVTRDTLSSFEVVITYDMKSLQYQPLSIVPELAGWTCTAVEDNAAGTLTIRGTGSVLRNGVVCRIRVVPFLSVQTALHNSIALDIASVDAVANNKCSTWETAGARLVVEQPCIGSFRAVRYSTEEYRLEQNAPNPAQGDITIEYGIGLDAHTSLVLYNFFGEQVATLVSAEQKAGTYRAHIATSTLPSGVYYYRLSSGPYTAVRQFLLAK